MPFPVDTGVPSYSGGYIPEIWSGKLLEKFYRATVFSEIANTDYEGEIKKFGDKVNIRTVPDVTINDYVKGRNLTYEWLTPGEVELLIDKGKYYGVKISDVDKKQSDLDFVNKWAEDASEQMRNAIDSAILADIYADADSANKGASAGAISGNINLGATGSPVALTKDNIIDMIVYAGQVLDEQDRPDTDRWFVLPAWAVSRIKLSDLKDASLTGDGTSVLRNGRIGMIDRFTIYKSNNVAHVTDSTYECFYCLFGHKSALTFATQLVENELIPNPNDFGQIMRGLQVYGYEVINPKSLGVLYARAA